jgi:transaldolase
VSHLLLDSANGDEIYEFMQSDAVRGVTTNPSLAAKEHIVGPMTGEQKYEDLLKHVCQNIVLAQPRSGYKRHLSVEVTTLTPGEMIDQARRLYDLIAEQYVSLSVHIKIPVMVETLRVIEKLGNRNIPINATACMTAEQACMASDAGATCVSFFYNRMIDGIAVDNERDLRCIRDQAAEEITTYKTLRPNEAYVICGSIRKPRDVKECLLAGADYVTASANVIREIVEHPKTVEAIKKFQEDIDKWLV